MVLVKLYLCFMPLLFNSQDTSKKDITIIGRAFNQKDGPWVLSKNGKIYYLDGMDDWDEKVAGKKVQVWGRLIVEEIKFAPRKSPEPGVPPPPIYQKTWGKVKRTILKAKWKLMK